MKLAFHITSHTIRETARFLDALDNLQDHDLPPAFHGELRCAAWGCMDAANRAGLDYLDAHPYTQTHAYRRYHQRVTAETLPDYRAACHAWRAWLCDLILHLVGANLRPFGQHLHARLMEVLERYDADAFNGDD